MKNPFRMTPMQKLEAIIASLTKRGEQVVAKVEGAEINVERSGQSPSACGLLSADLKSSEPPTTQGAAADMPAGATDVNCRAGGLA
jgi:hypothetical protein